ncbi:hypothetical protein KKC91_12930 [bacterium]|nr:hypothetical protein [bacterium]
MNKTVSLATLLLPLLFVISLFPVVAPLFAIDATRVLYVSERCLQPGCDEDFNGVRGAAVLRRDGSYLTLGADRGSALLVLDLGENRDDVRVLGLEVGDSEFHLTRSEREAAGAWALTAADGTVTGGLQLLQGRYIIVPLPDGMDPGVWRVLDGGGATPAQATPQDQMAGIGAVLRLSSPWVLLVAISLSALVFVSASPGLICAAGRGVGTVIALGLLAPPFAGAGIRTLGRWALSTSYPSVIPILTNLLGFLLGVGGLLLARWWAGRIAGTWTDRRSVSGSANLLGTRLLAVVLTLSAVVVSTAMGLSAVLRFFPGLAF